MSFSHTTASQNKELFQKGYDASVRSQVEAKYSRSTFLHTSGVEPGFNKDLWMMYDAPTTSQHISYGRTLNGNNDFYVIPAKSTGAGILFPRLLSTVGRAPTKLTAIRLPSSISAVAVAPQFSTPKRQVSVATDDGFVRVYELPLDWISGDLPADVTDAKYSYELGCRVQTMSYHPYVEDVLVCTGFHAESGKEVLFLFNLASEDSFQAYQDIITDRACSLSFSPDGTHLAIGDKKNNVVVLTLPSAQVRFRLKHGQVPKEVWPMWYNNEYLITVGNINGGQRGVTLHKIDWATSTTKVVKTESFFNNYLLIPHLDTTGVLICAGVGTANMNIFFIDPHSNSPIDNLSVFSSREDVVGIQFLEKRYCNVQEVEIIKAIKLTQKNNVWPIKFTVPRKRKEFFQDDIFATGAVFDPITDNETFFNAKLERAVLEDPQQTQFINVFKSLQPQGMIPLSQAPEEELTDRQQRYLQNKHNQFNQEKPKNFMGMSTHEEVDDYYAKKMENFGVYDRFSARTDRQIEDVADDEWD